MRISFRRVLLVLGVVVVLFMAWVAYSLFAPTPAIIVSPQTTFLTEPLGDDGLPDYGLAILNEQGEGVTPENNGAIPFWQAMWPGGLSPHERYPLLAELGMTEPEPGLKEPYEDVDLRQRLVQWLLDERAANGQDNAGANDSEDSRPTTHSRKKRAAREAAEATAEHWLFSTGQPWTAEQNAPLAEWVEECEALFDLLVEAGSRSHFYSPSPSLLIDQEAPLIAITLPAMQALRAAFRLLSMRALLHVGEDRYEEAWNELRACYRLSDHLAGQDTMILELVSIACAGITDEATLHLLDQPDLPTELAFEIHEEFKSRCRRNSMAGVMDRGERLAYLDVVLSMSKGTTGDADIDGLARAVNLFGMDWNLVLTQGNEWYDRLAAAAREEDWQKRQAKFDALEAEMASLQTTPAQFVGAALSSNSRSRLLSDLLVGMMLPATSSAQDAEDRHNTQFDLMRWATALTMYRSRHGEYPESLDALMPEFFQELPVDLFRRALFEYQKTADGYLLYSRGPNGQDDGGNSARLSQYKGYAVERGEDGNEEVVRQLLGEPADADAYTSSSALIDLIPEEADDHAIRLPRPVVPLRRLEP